jgi:uncharacterized protein DUF3455
VSAKAAGNAPGKTVNDIPWLKLEVTDRRGHGTLTGVTAVQRIDTQGGVHAGSCGKAASSTAPHTAPTTSFATSCSTEEHTRDGSFLPS